MKGTEGKMKTKIQVPDLLGFEVVSLPATSATASSVTNPTSIFSEKIRRTKMTPPHEGNPRQSQIHQRTPRRSKVSFRTAKMEERGDLYLRRQPTKAAAKESSKHNDFFRLPPVVLHKISRGRWRGQLQQSVATNPSLINSPKVRILLAG